MLVVEEVREAGTKAEQRETKWSGRVGTRPEPKAVRWVIALTEKAMW